MINKPIGPPALPDYPANWRPVVIAAVERSKRIEAMFSNAPGLAMLLRVECHRDRSFYNRMALSDITDMLGIALTMLAADEWFARQQCVYCGSAPVPGLLTCIGCTYAHPTF
jgi:hypothetical protein